MNNEATFQILCRSRDNTRYEKVIFFANNYKNNNSNSSLKNFYCLHNRAIMLQYIYTIVCRYNVFIQCIIFSSRKDFIQFF